MASNDVVVVVVVLVVLVVKIYLITKPCIRTSSYLPKGRERSLKLIPTLNV